ncbi:MAG: HAMP domain-containing histidine kinase [Firmicutes bacterium]|nr:HAMP domain-containing histidine kinase [Bacillota bacterium]
MNLRTKFITLVVGIVIIPFLSVLLVLALQLGLHRQGLVDNSLIKYVVTQKVARVTMPEAARQGTLGNVLDNLPQDAEVALVDEKGKVMFSTLPGLIEGETFRAEALSGAVNEGYEVQVLPLPLPNGEGRILIRMAFQSLFHTGFQQYRGLLIPLSLLLFSATMSVLIIRSIRRSISTLETAASRIAKGDLDFELEARGTDEIASLTRSFDTMRRRVKEELARRSRFIMGVSHDLKTPLALIEGYLDAIEDGYADDPEKLNRCLSIIKEKSKLLEGRIAQLIEFVKMDSSEWKSMHSRVRLRDFVTDLCEGYMDEAAVIGYRFEYSIIVPPNLGADMDVQLVNRVFENLISNAVRYSDSSKTVMLEAKQTAGAVEVSISNTGRGIPESEISYVFEPFYRGTNSRREEGFGLGLSTVKSIVETHGWDIRAQSTPGAETRFTVVIRPVVEV